MNTTMLLLDSYFHHLQARTGAQFFTIVRDDAVRPSQASDISSHITSPNRAEAKPLPGRLKRRSINSAPKFEAEKLDFKPPCPPTRVDSQDDMIFKSGLKRSLNERSTRPPQDLSSRFKSLFGTDMASTVKAKQMKEPQNARIEIKALANLAAPKFPIRRGSRDDLSTLPTSRRRIHHFPTGNGTSNQKIELVKFLDEVTSVLSDSKLSLEVRTRSNSDEGNLSLMVS